MSKVYVVQNPHRLNHDTGSLEPKYNLESAHEFGKIVYLLSPTASPFNPDHLIKELQEKLVDFGDEDKLLLIGNPVLMGLAVAIAADANNGKVNLLQWHGKTHKYIVVTIDNLFYEV